MVESVPIILEDNHQFETAVPVRKAKKGIINLVCGTPYGEREQPIERAKKGIFLNSRAATAVENHYICLLLFIAEPVRVNLTL